MVTPCSLGLSATNQQYFSLRTNQPPILFSQSKPAPAISHQPTEQAAESVEELFWCWVVKSDFASYLVNLLKMLCHDKSFF
jgi:hypothetical protein